MSKVSEMYVRHRGTAHGHVRRKDEGHIGSRMLRTELPRKRGNDEGVK